MLEKKKESIAQYRKRKKCQSNEGGKVMPDWRQTAEAIWQEAANIRDIKEIQSHYFIAFNNGFYNREYLDDHSRILYVFKTELKILQREIDRIVSSIDYFIGKYASDDSEGEE